MTSSSLKTLNQSNSEEKNKLYKDNEFIQNKYNILH